MLRTLSILSLIILVPQYLAAQVMPREGSVLNYRIIGFSVPAEQQVINYTLEIAAGNYDSEDSFKKNTINRLPGKTNKIIAEVPSFGSAYTWRVVYTIGNSTKTTSALFHFGTGQIPEVDTNFTRLRITKAALKYDSAYVFLDGNKTIYDMTGHPVWYLPKIEGKSLLPIDLKLSSQGTITFISDNAYEINYDGDILWKAPNDGKANGRNRPSYHHEFTRLNNGHYMILGMMFLPREIRPEPDSCRIVSDEKLKQPIRFGTIIEYDEHGNIVWSWKSSKYYEESDLINYQPPNAGMQMDIHENSFYFDEQNKIIYLSCKGISRIIKIKYPEGTVISNYGEIYKQGIPESGNDLFCGQHAISHSQDGCIFLFNNNSCHPGSSSKIEKLLEPVSEHDTLKKVWEYECSSDVSLQNEFPAGGNVVELPDHSLFVSTAAPDTKVFIVNMNKEILWSAQSERRPGDGTKWEPLTHYRASIIKSRKDLERLIWNAEVNHQPTINTNDLNVAGTHSELPVKPISGTQ